jgi:FAD dependent oxidoreductase
VHDRSEYVGDGRECVAVCGGGAAGMAAALASARAGADVILIEAKPRLGGTVAHTLIHTLGGLYDSAGELLNGGLAEELTATLARADNAVRRRKIGRTWVLNVCPDVYQAVTQRMIESEPRITVLHATRVSGVECATDTIRELELSGPGGVSRLRARTVIDATGTAEVARLVSPNLVQADSRRAAGGFIFRMRGVESDAVAFPKGLGILRALRSAVEDGTLDRHCANAWVDSGVRADEAYVKLAVPLPPDWRDREARGEVTREAQNTQAAVVEFLRQFPGFAQATVTRTGELGVRDGGRVCGEYCLTAEDVRQAAKFADVACRCCWPIEYWDPEQGVSLEYLPDKSYYEVPLRSLRVRGVRSLFAVGKCLSADRLAQASARVVGTCWAMGEAAGRAAAGL